MWHFGTCFNFFFYLGLWVVISEWSFWYVITFVNGILFLACPGCLSVPVLNTFILTFSTCVSPHSIMSVFGPDGGWSSPHKIPSHCLGSGISRLPKGLAAKVQPEPCSLIWCLTSWLMVSGQPLVLIWGFCLSLFSFGWHPYHPPSTPVTFLYGVDWLQAQSLLPEEVVLSISKKEF